MTKEENLHWLDQEIQTWENECQSKHPIKEALYAARKALEQEPCEDAVSRKAVHDMLENLPVTVENKWFNWLQKACIRLAELPAVTSQEPKTGYISIDDVMSVFDDFMCGEVDEEGTETFWEMLKDKAESEEENDREPEKAN